MTTRTASQIYAGLIAAGYSPASAQIQTAIDLAESGGNDAAVGDVGLETASWGPSYGEAQIRTLKAQTGTGSDRDIAWLSASDANQDKAEYDISQGGRDFTAWTTFNTGAYQRYMGQAAAAAKGIAGAIGGAASSAASSASSAVSAVVLTGVRKITLEGLFATAGAGLVVAGVTWAMWPKVKRVIL